MGLEPFDWNAVIVGYWNRAILTPSGIAKRLFKIPEGTGMEVFLPVDQLEPPLVKYEGITVRVENHRLIIGADKGGFGMLTKAMEMGCNALNALPDTPVLAAGFNIRFKTAPDHEEIGHIIENAQLDGCLSEAGYEIVGRLLNRRVRCKNPTFEKGTITISLDVREDAAKIELNFNRDSRDVKELTDWLSASQSDMEQAVNDILSSCGCTKCEELKHV